MRSIRGCIYHVYFILFARFHANEDEEDYVARKTILVCDNCGKEVAEAKGAVMRINFNDARRGSSLPPGGARRPFSGRGT